MSSRGLPRIHPRVEPTELARREIADAVMKAKEKHGLTMAEETKILASLLSDIASWALRVEREDDR